MIPETTLTSTCQVKLISREEIAERTIALYLEKPKGFSFKAGQNIDISLVDHKEIDPEGCSRTFSIVSAPHEDFLEIAFRLRENPYKNSLNNLQVGSELLIDGPYGSFGLHDNENIPAIFLLSGIGVTPAISILRHAAHTKNKTKFCLFYLNRYKERAAYYNELKDYENRLPDYKFIPVMTRPEESQIVWPGETGYINTKMLARYISNFKLPRFYLVGATSVVWEMVKVISTVIDRDRIRVEDFTGF